MRIQRILFCLLPTAFCLLSLGCANQYQRQAERAVTEYFFSDYPSAAKRLSPMADKTDEHFVLNNLRLGSTLLAMHDYDEAEAAFLRAYEVINSVGVNNGGRSLGAVLVDEKLRVWKGEPFERAMANFYLGLIYYIRQDYNNARGAFENALFKLQQYDEDKDSFNGEFASSFALGHLMLAKSYQRLGRDDLAQDHFSQAVRIRSYLEPIADFERNAKSNLLLVIDFGYGPEKVGNADGVLAGFAPMPRDIGPIPQMEIELDGTQIALDGASRPPMDLLAMAQDRKWQSIDTIRATKSTIGTGMILGGAGYGVYRANSGRMNGEDLAIAAGLIGAGLLLKATSQADLRYWEMLPRTTFVVPLHVSPGKHDVTVRFPGDRSSQTWRGFVVPNTGEATYYIRMQRHNPGPFDWPPMQLDEPPAHPPAS